MFMLCSGEWSSSTTRRVGGRIVGVRDTFSALNETALTCITNETVARHKFDDAGTLRVWAEQTAFELKDSLKRRGYRWNDGSDGRPKSWFRDVDETALDDEIAFLRTEIYMQDVE